MSLLMLADAFPPCPQSASERLSSFTESLRSNGYHVTVVTANNCSKRKKASTDKGVLVYDLKYPLFLLSISSAIFNPIVFLLYFFISCAIIIGNKPKVLLSSLPNGEVAVAGFLLSKTFRIPLLVDMRDFYPTPSHGLHFLRAHLPRTVHEIMISFFRFIFRNSDKIICVDESIKEKLVQLGVSSERVQVVPNGADTDTYQPCSPEERERRRLKYRLPSSKFIFVYAGSLATYYPIAEAIKGVKRLYPKNEDFLLLIMSYMNLEHLKELVQELGLEDEVKFLGPFSPVQAAEVLSACDVGIVTYRSEDYWKGMYGAKMFSYMSCGLPILASGPINGVIENFIRRFNTGVFIYEPNEANFAKGYAYCLSNRTETKSMGHRARETVEGFYNRTTLGLRVVSIVDKLSV
jgi:glycosyltransferase involved in cell wall biosynthesis